jgi:hypothetical protein
MMSCIGCNTPFDIEKRSAAFGCQCDIYYCTPCWNRESTVEGFKCLSCDNRYTGHADRILRVQYVPDARPSALRPLVNNRDIVIQFEVNVNKTMCLFTNIFSFIVIVSIVWDNISNHDSIPSLYSAFYISSSILLMIAFARICIIGIPQQYPQSLVFSKVLRFLWILHYSAILGVLYVGKVNHIEQVIAIFGCVCELAAMVTLALMSN